MYLNKPSIKNQLKLKLKIKIKTTYMDEISPFGVLDKYFNMDKDNYEFTK